MNPSEPSIRIENGLGVCGVRGDTRLLAALAGQVSPGRALDLGTGSGYVGIYLARLGWQVDAVDISPRALAEARHNADLNRVSMNIYGSDLLSAASGRYDVIACNPPMRPDETEASRVLTSTLRRAGPLANLLLRLTQPFLERKRLQFLATIARQAEQHLAPGGRLLLVISPLEARELPSLVPGLGTAGLAMVEEIPNLLVASFGYGRTSP